MEKKYGDLRSGLVLLALCLVAYFWLIPTQIKAKEDVAIGPDFFPRLMVICCGLCAAGVAVQGAAGLRKEGKLSLAAFGNPANRVDWKSYARHLLFLAAALALFGLRDRQRRLPDLPVDVLRAFEARLVLSAFGHLRCGDLFHLYGRVQN